MWKILNKKKKYDDVSYLDGFPIYFILGLWAFICLFPIYWVFITSFKEAYVVNLESCISSGGYAVIETFSNDGAKVCCGLDLQTYDENMLIDLLGENWILIDSIRHTHINPFGGERPYISTIFKRI